MYDEECEIEAIIWGFSEAGSREEKRCGIVMDGQGCFEVFTAMKMVIISMVIKMRWYCQRCQWMMMVMIMVHFEMLTCTWREFDRCPNWWWMHIAHRIIELSKCKNSLWVTVLLRFRKIWEGQSRAAEQLFNLFFSPFSQGELNNIKTTQCKDISNLQDSTFSRF